MLTCLSGWLRRLWPPIHRKPGITRCWRLLREYTYSWRPLLPCPHPSRQDRRKFPSPSGWQCHPGEYCCNVLSCRPGGNVPLPPGSSPLPLPYWRSRPQIAACQTRADDDDILMIEPPPDSSISGMAFCIPRNTLSELIAWIRCQPSSDSELISPTCNTAALFTRMSSRP